MRDLANLLAKPLGKEGGREGGREGGKDWLTEEEIGLIVPGGQNVINEALKAVANPRKAIFKMRDLANLLAKQLGTSSLPPFLPPSLPPSLCPRDRQKTLEEEAR